MATPPAPAEAPGAGAARERLVGGAYALIAYVLWGVMPLYFLALVPSTPWEVVAWRIAMSLVFCILLLTIVRGWRGLGRVLRRPRLVRLTGLAGALIFVNWQTYLIATLGDRVVEASLGYFINPIVTVLLGVLVLGERLRLAQWIAIGLAAIAVTVTIVGYGAVPWVALILAASFGTDGLVKKAVGPSVDAITGLTLESAWLAPVAIVQLVVVGTTSGLTIFTAGPVHAALLLLAGVATATPLIAFAAGARRVPLVAMGLLQFVAPILQFAIGVWVLHEAMPLERWIGFALVWAALVVLMTDSVLAARRGRAAASDVTELA